MSLARALTADDPARMNLRRRFVRYRASSSAATAPPRVGVVFEREDGSRDDDDDDGDVYDAVCARTGAPVGTAEAREALRHVAEGETEPSIIWRANTRTFDVAAAALDASLWDAPYQEWATFSFEEVFSV